MMSIGANIRPTISSGISSVVMMKDFLRTRSLNSRPMMIPTCDMVLLVFMSFVPEEIDQLRRDEQP